MKDVDAQLAHWERTFLRKAEMFGAEPSQPARKAAALFKTEGKSAILELGAGQGRDTLFLARNGFIITAVDYAQAAVDAIDKKAQDAGVGRAVTAIRHDVREPLPFPDGSFDCCYSHMLFCMALATSELVRLSREVRRVLKPGGLTVFTVRHTQDPHYGTGIHRGEDLYEVDGFVVHFFSREKVELLAEGYEVAGIEELEEGALPRKLFQVVFRKGGAEPQAPQDRTRT